MKATRLEKQLYDALENIISELYADGPSISGEKRAENALASFKAKYGDRHDGKEVSN